MISSKYVRTLALVAVAIIAITLRFYKINDLVYTLWVDEAWFSLMGVGVVRGENFIPLTPPAIGHGESLFQIYGSALMQLLGGVPAYSSRHWSAVTGTASVALGGLLWFQILPHGKSIAARQSVALLTSFILATTFTLILHSRHGLQMSGGLMMSTFSLIALYQTYKYKKYSWAIATGVALAVANITYEAALALPVLLLSIAGLRIVFDVPQARGHHFKLTVTILFTGLIAFSPMAIFYYRNPGIYLAHAFQTQGVMDGSQDPQAIAALADTFLSMLSGYLLNLRSVFISGDQLIGRNIPGRPMFDYLISPFVLWGAWRYSADTWRKFENQFLWISFFVLLIPASLADSQPAFPRMLFVTPLLAGIAGYGLADIYEQVAKRSQQWKMLAICGLSLLLITSGVWSTAAYFRWATDPSLFDPYFQPARLTAEKALELDSRGEQVLLTTQSEPYLSFPYQLLLPESSIQTFDASDSCFPYADELANTQWYGVVHHYDKRSADLLYAAYGADLKEKRDVIRHAVYGSAFTSFYPIEARTPGPHPSVELKTEFENGIQLKGYDLLRQDTRLNLTLYWSTNHAIQHELSQFVHIGVGEQSDPFLAQNDKTLCPGYATFVWQPGWVMVDRTHIQLPADIDQYPADIRIGIYNSHTGHRIPILSSEADVENNRLLLGPVTPR